MEIDEIKKYKTYLQDDRNSQRIANQKRWQDFYDNKFELPLVKNIKYQIRPFSVAEMINGITLQMIGDNPRVYTKPRKDTDTAKAGADRIASEGNRWCKRQAGYSNNPFRETFKKLMARGEAWLYIVHDPVLAQWEGDWREIFPDAIPVMFIPYDPMIVFNDPSEDFNGKPTKVVVAYQTTVSELEVRYPKWGNPKGRQGKEKADFFLYSDRKMSYAEADDCLLYTSPSPRDGLLSRMPSSA